MKHARYAVLAATLVVTPGLARAEQAAAAKPAPAPAATGNPAKIADIERLMAATGARQMAEQMLGQMLQIFRQGNPNVPAEVWTELQNAFGDEDLMKDLVGVYDKHLTHDDIKALLQFFESPVGRKLVKVQPLIMQDSMAIGQAWGARAGERMRQRLKEKGFTAS
jgi:uncharacterized protein